MAQAPGHWRWHWVTVVPGRTRFTFDVLFSANLQSTVPPDGPPFEPGPAAVSLHRDLAQIVERALRRGRRCRGDIPVYMYAGKGWKLVGLALEAVCDLACTVVHSYSVSLSDTPGWSSRTSAAGVDVAPRRPAKTPFSLELNIGGFACPPSLPSLCCPLLPTY